MQLFWNSIISFDNIEVIERNFDFIRKSEKHFTVKYSKQTLIHSPLNDKNWNIFYVW